MIAISALQGRVVLMWVCKPTLPGFTLGHSVWHGLQYGSGLYGDRSHGLPLKGL